jgi:hypothetical protein
MMSGAVAILLAMGLAAGSPVETPSPGSKPAPMKCETGPVKRTFGGTEWIVYSCEDKASMVVVSAEGNPATPFFFFLRFQDGSYRIRGEGNGDRRATDAAFQELAKMTPADFAALLEATKKAA